MSEFQLRFSEAEILHWSKRYNYSGESDIVTGVATTARDRGYLTKDEFIKITRWKTARSRSRCASNDSALVEEVTRISFSAAHEELKIAVLLVLKGVSWPTASVLLHFCDRDRYPILDFRAL